MNVQHVAGRALLDRAKVGDKIRFKAEQAGGQLVVTELVPVK